MRPFFAGIAAAALVAGAAAAAEKPVPQDNRTGLAVTLYADGFGLIKDRRTVSLDAGANTLAFEGVSARMIPSSALVRAESGIRVLEQNFEFDLITPQTLLQRSVGKTIRVIRTHPTTGEDVIEPAEVLAAGQGTVLRIGDRIETGVPGRLVFDSIPEGLRAEPALLLEVDSAAALERELQLAYLTDGLKWRAEYVVELDPKGDKLDLSAWASLSNSTGTAFSDADVQLVAGDVRREFALKAMAAPMARAEMAQSMSRADNCYDNAFMESCFGTLKTELEMEAYPNAHVARKEIPDYIRYYNTRRRHSALGYLTPEAYETMISQGSHEQR